MGFFNRIFAEEGSGATPAPTDPFWYHDVSGRGDMEGAVTDQKALQLTSVYSCVKILSETVAMLPLQIFERLEGGKRKAEDHYLYNVLHDQPNKINTSFEWREYMQGSAALRGNGYSLILPGVSGAVDSLQPLVSQWMKVRQLDNGRLQYIYTDQGGMNTRTKTYVQDEIFHLRGGGNTIEGTAVLTQHRKTINISTSTDTHAGNFFNNGARPGGVLKQVSNMGKELAIEFKRQWQSEFGGAKNAHRVALLPAGMEWQNIGMSNEDAQFLETRKYQVRDICRIFRIPPHLVGDLEQATFSNIEQQSLEFVMYTMYPWFKRWEQAINRDLITDPRFYAEFNFDALLRCDSASRSTIYSSAISSGWLTRNEVREKENLNPLPGLDEPVIQVNMTNTNPGKAPDPNAPPPRRQPSAGLAAVVNDAARRVISCESRDLGRALRATSTPEGAVDAVAAFYKEKVTYFCTVFHAAGVLAEELGFKAGAMKEAVEAYASLQQLRFASCNDTISFTDGLSSTVAFDQLTKLVMDTCKHEIP